jgi:hypothetical protein
MIAACFESISIIINLSMPRGKSSRKYAKSVEEQQEHQLKPEKE